jgi:hypothetical protein
VKPKISFLGCKFFKKEYSYFFIIYNPFLKDFYMHIIHTISLILLALGCNNITYGMHTAPSISHKFSRSCSQIIKIDASQQRGRETFQEWCQTPIDWNKNITTIKTQTSEIPTRPQEDKMAFYKQCDKQQK